MTRARGGALALALALVSAGACGRSASRAPATAESATAAGVATSALPDSAAAVRAALDTLTRTGARDYVADSLVRHGDTLTVWTGPRVWNATDRPMSAVSVVPPARVVAVRHIMGG